MATKRTNPNRLMTLLLVLELVMVAHGQTRATTLCNHSGVPLLLNGLLLNTNLCLIIQILDILTIVLTTGPSSNPSIPFPKDVTLANIVRHDNCLVVVVLAVTRGSTVTEILDLLGILCLFTPTPSDHNSLTGHEYASLPGSLAGHEEYANLNGQEKYASLKGVAGM